ncbi:DUF6099 family protein [Kitasatospora aureofaciens]|uniref:Uncharacterized protein n=1 Tax=Kitasatospora aureofaciens TaxID=1894 RepID=A0A1E7MZC0_KITAU|nr:DUF6099 family protein [Kitasatospora aureofaciens]ARF80373.1 hypothetical protein B6264_16970 [Kitasatospora aureofaciens]OEV33795.1 hypothetical protein HS99_0037600 [Kitasatospora aureofaciens]GGU96301.1 hypothetical protein GCM10010502_57830 [Kitasatospora aureofaciens]
MEALRLIKTARHALAEARQVPDVLGEARQVALLTEAVGARLAESEDEELTGLGQQLSEAGAHAAVCLDRSVADGTPVSGGRAGRLTELGELQPTLEALDGLLRDVGETLVVLACGADTESLYWTCIDGVDAMSECKDVTARLREAVDRGGGVERTALGGAEPERAGGGSPLLVVRLGPPGEGGPTEEERAPDYRVPAAVGASEVSVPAG